MEQKKKCINKLFRPFCSDSVTKGEMHKYCLFRPVFSDNGTKEKMHKQTVCSDLFAQTMQQNEICMNKLSVQTVLFSVLKYLYKERRVKGRQHTSSQVKKKLPLKSLKNNFLYNF
ncbi:UNVERIFIED_CONTAM: hypothetical protein RMT77_007174 [Armadillidium vulgare]